MILPLFILALVAFAPHRASGAGPADGADDRLAQFTLPPADQPGQDEDEDPEDEGVYDTAPDSTQEFQPLYQLPGEKIGGAAPTDTTAAPTSGILLPSSAEPDTLRPVSPAPGAAPGTTTAKPKTEPPKPKNGVFGMSPVMIVAGLVVLHVLVVRAATY